uniref:Uncharacterized protein n=1 Tax=Brassica oleracea TaxID=3712 RepID=A0A3P6CIJ7_BRAOL|nr:unnamed protein product [Brassica oleracea]
MILSSLLRLRKLISFARKGDWSEIGQGVVLCFLFKMFQETPTVCLISHVYVLQQHQCSWCSSVCTYPKRLNHLR